MRTVVKISFFGWLAITNLSMAADASDLSVGFQSGYAALGNFNAVALKNSFPLAVNLTYKFTNRFRTEIEYQWLHSEHSGSVSANFNTFRTTPTLDIYTINHHRFSAGAGLGYQYARLSQLDTVRHFELSVGPSWNWQLINNCSLVTNFFYTRSINETFQHLDFQLGMSYAFGRINHPIQQAFSDDDQDGIANDNDQCAQTPYGVKVSKTGCPIDSDFDSVADYKDFCPHTPKTETDDLGCPTVAVGRGVIDGIAFEINGPRLTEESKLALITVAENLKKFPNLLFLIEGYAATSTTDQRMIISKARARSVMNILMSYGVPEGNMQAVGLGNQYPLTDSHDARDRILNERIEIKWKPLLNRIDLRASH